MTLRALGHLRFEPEQSRGRRYGEPPHPYRNDFQRDRDRVVHARAFRRLENKTQVFAPWLSDHFRNRLTHTLEVSQIARTVAGALGLNEDFTEALALAHDIGHPPLGHAGEAELNRHMQRFGEGFDHNRHALRIVESFENPYPRFPGLNLTFEVREGIVKHSRDFAPGEIPELEEYLPGQKPPIEAQLIDLCDEIAYNTADLDDAYTAGLLRVEDACQASAAFCRLWEAAGRRYPGIAERVRVKEVVRGLIDRLVTGLIQGSTAAAAALKDGAAVRALPERVARFTEESAQLSLELKRFLRSTVYESEAVQKARGDSVARLGALFEFLLAHPDRMPAAYLQEAVHQPLHRQVCDYIAGMTDGFFDRTCRQFGIG